MLLKAKQPVKAEAAGGYNVLRDTGFSERREAKEINTFVNSNGISHGGRTDEFRPESWPNIVGWWVAKPSRAVLVQNGIDRGVRPDEMSQPTAAN